MSNKNRKRRVVILADAQTHMMPALAREMARRDHDLVLGDAMNGLADELTKLGAKVEVVPDTADQTKADTIQKPSLRNSQRPPDCRAGDRDTQVV